MAGGVMSPVRVGTRGAAGAPSSPGSPGSPCAAGPCAALAQAEAAVAAAARLQSARRLDGPDADAGAARALREALEAAARRVARVRGLGRAARPRVLLLEGRLAALRGEAQAEELLGRAVKLDPLTGAAWNALAELYWSRGALGEARDCLEACLEIVPGDARSLRNLSLLLRKMGEGPEERVRLALASLARAKEAVALDAADGESWYVLGNAYLSLFFAVSHDGRDLDRALKAYARAEQLAAKLEEPGDLYYNRAQVYGYLEDFAAARADYAQAQLLDPRLPCEERVAAIARKAAASAELIAKKGHLKPKRLAAIVRTLGDDCAGDQQLAFAPAQGAACARAVADLAPGENRGRRIDLKVLGPLVRSSEPPVSFLAADRDGRLVGLSVYHLDASVLARVRPDRDRVTLLEPFLAEVDFQGASYTLLQLRYPMQFFVNGEALTAQIAHSVMGSTSC